MSTLEVVPQGVFDPKTGGQLLLTRVWVTKWALTKGIIAAGAVVNGAYAKVPLDAFRTQVFGKGDWHLTREDAVKRAKEMAAVKAAQLRRQAQQLEEQTFE